MPPITYSSTFITNFLLLLLLHLSRQPFVHSFSRVNFFTTTINNINNMPPDISAKRIKTFHYNSRLSSSFLSFYQNNLEKTKLLDHELDIVKLTNEMNQRAKDVAPFNDLEIDEIVQSFQNILPQSSPGQQDDSSSINFDEFKQFLTQYAHLSHKDWNRTGQSAQLLRELLLPSTPDTLDERFKFMFQRVLNEGNWENAVQHAKSTSTSKPWAILVTGVNGIRKTTSVYQSWFPQLLMEALVPPPSTTHQDEARDVDIQTLPTGENSFFRQLDHMIATLVNYHFLKMYHMTSEAHDFSSSSSSSQPPDEVISNYSNYKAAIFTRYRTLSEILGVLLVRQAQTQKINIMVETSGRDVAMFEYVDKFFPSNEYNKLALHFSINDLSFAEKSVDRRMVREMQDGISAMQSENGTVQDVIKANAGGPYGSQVLKGVQADSDRVWGELINGETSVGDDWYKATIKIDAYEDKPWTATAIKADGSEGTTFPFGSPRKV